MHFHFRYVPSEHFFAEFNHSIFPGNFFGFVGALYWWPSAIPASLAWVIAFYHWLWAQQKEDAPRLTRTNYWRYWYYINNLTVHHASKWKMFLWKVYIILLSLCPPGSTTSFIFLGAVSQWPERHTNGRGVGGEYKSQGRLLWTNSTSAGCPVPGESGQAKVAAYGNVTKGMTTKAPLEMGLCKPWKK